MTAGFNAKLSEYHSAIGLASLDLWSETRPAWMSVAGAYRQALAKSNHINLQAGFGETWVSSTCIVSVGEAVHARAQQALAAAGIETRLWWGNGAHNQPATAEFPRARLPATENLAKSTFGLPFYQDLKEDQVQHVVATLMAAVSSVKLARAQFRGPNEKQQTLNKFHVICSGRFGLSHAFEWWNDFQEAPRDRSRHGNRGRQFIGSTLVKYLVREIGVVTLNIDKLTYAGTLSSLAEVASSKLYQFAKADIADSFRPCAPRCVNSGQTW